MRYLALILVVLVACATAPEMKETVVEPASNLSVPATISAEPVTRTIKQAGGFGTFIHGLSEDNRILQVQKLGEEWNYTYRNKRLIEISGSDDIEFFYTQGVLSGVDIGKVNMQFVYDQAGRLKEVKGSRETVYLDYDSLNRITKVRRGVSGATSFEYDKNNQITAFVKGDKKTLVIRDDRNRLRNFDGDDTKFIMGYWKDDRLISLTGQMFGQGLSVSYGPQYPAFEASVINAEDDSVFKAAYSDSLYKVVDQYLYCKYVRRLKDVPFEATSFIFYTTYFNATPVDYFAMEAACKPYEA